MKLKKTALVLALLLAAPLASVAGETKISGLMFGDYYWIADHSDAAKYKNLNGIQIRRIYLTFDRQFESDFKGRLRFEINQPDFSKPSAKFGPVIKDAYLQKKFKGQKLTLGMSGTPTWGLVEKHWGLRSVEKSPLDLEGFGSSRDTGVKLSGKPLNKLLSYSLMAAAGSSNKSEGADVGKKYYAAFGVHPFGGVVDLEVYADYSNAAGGTSVGTKKGVAFDPDQYDLTTQIFAGIKGEAGRMGLLYASQQKGGRPDPAKAGENLDPVINELVSGWLVWNATQKIAPFLRVDHMLAGSVGKSGITYIQTQSLRRTVMICGIDYAATDNIKFQPNIETVTYRNDFGGLTPAKDVIPRLTMFYKF